MDAEKFDFLTRSLTQHSSRRFTLKALTAGLVAGVTGRLGLAPAEAQQLSAAKCVELGKSCKRKKGEGKPSCCARARCRNNRCACGNNTVKCGNTCITRRQCCRDNDCTGGQRCRNNRCVCGGGQQLCDGACIPANDVCPGGGCLPFSLEGQATADGDDGATLLCDATDTSALSFGLPGGSVDFDDITQLQTLYTYAAGDTCGGGAIRFSLTTGDGNVFVYIGPTPSFTGCPSEVETDTGNLIGNNDQARYDTSQLDGGSVNSTYDEARDLIESLGLSITGIFLVNDACSFFGPPDNSVDVEPCVQIA